MSARTLRASSRTCSLGGVPSITPSRARAISRTTSPTSSLASTRATATRPRPGDWFVPTAFGTCVQLDTAVHNTIAQAQNLDIHAPADNEHLAYLEEPDVFGFENGYVTAPDAPGLGIEIDESEVQTRSQTGLGWQNPIWYHDDGSVAEW